MAWYEVLGKSKKYIPPTWADGTDEEIVEALEKHYNNEIDLTEYWSVGDERVVHLSAIGTSGSYPMETQSAQDVIFVILNIGGKELATPINGHTECTFIVGLKNCLNTKGAMCSSSNTNYGWSSSTRRGWCNEKFRNALPSTIKSIFKQHNNYVSNKYNATTYTKSEDYFCLPSVKEVTGTNGSANANAEAKNTLLTYYGTSTNRIKTSQGSGTTQYWTSSKSYYSGSTTSFRQRMCSISGDGASNYSGSTTSYGIAPQGVI